MSATVSLHPSLTAAQAQQVLRQIGARLQQDGRGNVRLVPAKPQPVVIPFNPQPEPPRAA